MTLNTKISLISAWIKKIVFFFAMRMMRNIKQSVCTKLGLNYLPYQIRKREITLLMFFFIYISHCNWLALYNTLFIYISYITGIHVKWLFFPQWNWGSIFTEEFRWFQLFSLTFFGFDTNKNNCIITEFTSTTRKHVNRGRI